MGIKDFMARRVIAAASRSKVVSELSRGSTAEQYRKLSEMVSAGYLPPERLRKAIADKAPKEMEKAIAKFHKEGKEVTVDSLLAEVRSEPEFIKLCERVGLTEAWFEGLASVYASKSTTTERGITN